MKWWDEFVYWATVKPRLRRLSKWFPEAKFYPCGSRYVCSPPVFGTDIDFLVYTKEPITERLLWLGFVMGRPGEYGLALSGTEKFNSWRKGSVNLIVTSNKDFAERHNTATHICKTQNITEKWHRIRTYEVVREEGKFWEYGNSDHPTPPKLEDLLVALSGPHKMAIYHAYRAKHGLTE